MSKNIFYNAVLTFFILVVVQATALSATRIQALSAKQAAELFAKPQNKLQLLNRTVLQVESDVYSAHDLQNISAVYFVLGKYLKASEKNKNFSANKPYQPINWLQYRGQDFNAEKSFTENLQTMPEDVQNVLFVTFVLAESKRMSLFRPNADDIGKAVRYIQQLPEKAEFKNISQNINSISIHDLKRYVELVLNAFTYKRIRGGFDKNQSLSDVNWFWHG